jgi:hypothetical protein
MALPIVETDPVLFDAASYQSFRAQSRDTRRRKYQEVIAHARTVRDNRVFAQIQELLAAHGDGQTPDLHYSRTFSGWVGGIERELEQVEGGRDPACLDYYSDEAAFARDVAAEYPQHGLVKGSVPFELIDGSIAVVPLQAVVRSRRVGVHIRSVVFRHIDWDSDKAAFDPVRFRRCVGQIEASLAALRSSSPRAYEGFKASIHSIPVLPLRVCDELSASSAADQPGTIVMSVSDTMLERQDVPLSTSMLYHEHAHNKLALFLFNTPGGLGRERVFITPFHNELRAAEKVLHQVYPIALESATWLLVMRSSPRNLRRAVVHLGATAARLSILVDLLPLIEAEPACSGLITRLEAFARAVLAEIASAVQDADPELRRQCQEERERVQQRHIWDVGQFLARGIRVRDPGLETWDRDDREVRFVYRGARHHAVVEEFRPGESRHRFLGHQQQ